MIDKAYNAALINQEVYRGTVWDNLRSNWFDGYSQR